MLPLGILTMATTCAIHRSFLVIVFRVMATKQLFLTIIENRFIKNRGLHGSYNRHNICILRFNFLAYAEKSGESSSCSRGRIRVRRIRVKTVVG